MKRAILAAAIAAVLTLTGCASTTLTDDTSRATARESSAPAPADVSPAPLAAEPAAPTANTVEGDYLSLVRDELGADTVIPDATDDQLLTAGRAACDQLSAGTDPYLVNVIEGEQPNGLGIYQDSSRISGAAMLTLCPDQAR